MNTILTIKDFAWESWVPVDQAVLLFLFQGEQVLLIHKKRGLGKGKINGPGGRLEAGESFLQAAIRETEEETGLVVSDLEEVGELSFVFTNGHSIFAKVFFAYQYRGEMVETEEADPFWHPWNQLPFDRMWEDDKEWLPLALEGQYFKARFIFDEDTMIDKDVVHFPRKKRN